MNGQDQLATAHSQQLAMVRIEDMEDYDTVKLLVSNVDDILYRAQQRMNELMPQTAPLQWGEEFTVDSLATGIPIEYHAMWLRKQHKEQNKACSTCGQVVPGIAPRLRVRNGPNSFVTIASKGVKNEYNCIVCALKVYGTAQPL